jgi:dTDP-4-dehydrorhamnose reductase
MYLIIGGDGLLGTALLKYLDNKAISAIATSRRRAPNLLDLSKFIPPLPEANIVYIVAAVPKIIECERDPKTWTINADAPVAIARQCARRGSFVVFVSTDAVQRDSNLAYARQKAYAESYMNTIDAAIVRPSRFTADTVDLLARYLYEIGRDRLVGVHQWPVI